MQGKGPGFNPQYWKKDRFVLILSEEMKYKYITSPLELILIK